MDQRAAHYVSGGDITQATTGHYNRSEPKIKYLAAELYAARVVHDCYEHRRRMTLMFQDALTLCAQTLGPSPHSFSWWDCWTYWRIPRPEWLYQDPDDPLETLFHMR